jgi:Fe2+ transport system protein FeoA
MESSSLADTPVGTFVRIHLLQSTPETSNRLRELGFCENSLVRLTDQNDTRMICEILNSRVGISSSVARQILVSPCE